MPPAPVAAALAIYLAGQAVTAFRWQRIARAAGFRACFRNALRWYFVGMFFNLAGPSTLGGDVARAVLLARAPGPGFAAALSTVAFDRFVGLFALTLLAAVAVAACGTFGIPGAAAAAVFAWLAAMAVMGVLARHPRIERTAWGTRLAARVWRDDRLLGASLALSLPFHLLQIAAALLVGRAVGLAMAWQVYLVVHPLATVAGALPISVAGIGVREASSVWLLAEAGAPSGQAAAFALVWLGVLVAASLVGGLVFAVSDVRVTGASADPAHRPRADTRRD